jgi:hypothetical protein
MVDYTSRENRIVFTHGEIDAMDKMLAAGDRAGFYLTYYAMTDSSEALLQSKIATFSGMAEAPRSPPIHVRCEGTAQENSSVGTGCASICIRLSVSGKSLWRSVAGSWRHV